MTLTEWGQIGTTVAVLGSWLSQCYNIKKNRRNTKQEFINLHLQLNDRMDKWIKLERSDATEIEKKRGENQRK